MLHKHCSHYELIILNADNVTLKRCNVLNPATLRSVPSHGELNHDCTEMVLHPSQPGEDLQDQPLENLSLNLFTCGPSDYVREKDTCGEKLRGT